MAVVCIQLYHDVNFVTICNFVYKLNIKHDDLYWKCYQCTFFFFLKIAAGQMDIVFVDRIQLFTN